MSQLDHKEVALAAIYIMHGFAGCKQHQQAIEAWYKKGYEGGHLELMAIISAFALEVVTIQIERSDDEYPGVFHYEVVEPFGKWLCEQVAASGKPPSEEDGNRKLRELTHAFFTQGEASEFQEFEIRPVLLTSAEEVKPFTTFAEAAAALKASMVGQIQWAIYGKGNDGLYQHIADHADKNAMLQYVRQFIGVELQWPHLDRMTFARTGG